MGFDSYLHVMDIAVDVRKLAFAVLVGIAWLVLTAILGWVLLETSAWWLGLFLILLWTCACLGIAVGGVSRAVAIELSEHHRIPLGGIFSFVFRHIAGLSLVVLGVTLAVLLAGLIINGLIVGLGMIPGLGPILVGLLVIPLFLVNLVLWILLLQVLLVPAVMGVEDCSPMTAFTRVLSLIRHHGGRFLAYVAVAGIVVSLVGVFIFFMLAPPFMATMATSGGGTAMMPGGPSFSSGSISPFIYMMNDMRVPLLEPEQVAHAQWNNPGRNPWEDMARQGTSRSQGPGLATRMGTGLAGLSGGILMVSILSLFFVYGVACLVVTYRATQDEIA